MDKNLLYLEDDKALAQMTVKAFERRGFQVKHFRSIGELENAYAYHQFTHALFDMKLDDGNSLDLIAKISDNTENLKIVLLTGYASIATAVQAIKLGAHNYLTKPASIDEILTAFEENAETDSPSRPMSLKRIEWEKIQQALVENDGNITVTAKKLNMHRRTLQRKLAKKPVAY